jgi:hypothetical protein
MDHVTLTSPKFSFLQKPNFCSLAHYGCGVRAISGVSRFGSTRSKMRFIENLSDLAEECSVVKGFWRKAISGLKIPCRTTAFSVYPDSYSTFMRGLEEAKASASCCPPISGITTSVTRSPISS